MLKVVHVNDLHIGLVTDGIERTSEIIGIVRDAIKHAVKLQKQGNEVIFVIGGDVFNNNNPSEKLIRDFIEGVLNPLKKFNITSFVIAGNHDTIADPDRLSCLGFIKSIGKGYSNIKLIDDLSFEKIKTTDFGYLNFIFLPHITRAHLEFGERKDDYNGTQDYIEEWAKDTKKELGKGSINYVFSHLNVHGAHGGSEENLLKKSEAFIPEAFMYSDNQGFTRPQIIQSHIHSRQTTENINIVGSQIYCGFGEAETEKYFLELSIPTNMGEEESFKYIKTKCVQFKQLELNLTDKNWDGVTLTGVEEVKEFLSKLNKKEKIVIKFDLTINSKECSVNWEEERIKLAWGSMWNIKPIVPRFVNQKVFRSIDQKLGLDPKEAVKTFLKNNKPDRAKNKWKLAQRYL
jgi:DNA repair exonuclease SbcCD nuclease subunit